MNFQFSIFNFQLMHNDLISNVQLSLRSWFENLVLKIKNSLKTANYKLKIAQNV